MRAALVATLVAAAAAGCGGGGATTSAGALSATFSNLAGANTSGVAISTMTVGCQYAAATAVLTCSGSELPDNKGRAVSVTVWGPKSGMDYPIGAGSATVFFEDPTTLGTASGMRQWQSVDGTGSVRVVAFDSGASPHAAFSYAATMRPLASPAAGSFDIVGDGNIDQVVAAP